MGVTVAALRLLAEMAGNGLFDGKPRSVVEFGSQDLHCQHENIYRAVFSAFGAPAAFDGAGVGDLVPSRRLFEVLGFDYACIDLDGRAGTLPWDLNEARCPDSHKGRFTLATNHGTTEHLIGQHNAFRMIHDLTAVGGYMMHVLPCTGEVDHGFFRYSPAFFKYLSEANGYETIYFMITDRRNFLAFSTSDTLPAFSYIVTVLAKTADTPFRSPMQILAGPAEP
jgi:hypothetical protein